MKYTILLLLLTTALSAQIPCYDMEILRPLGTEDYSPYRTVFSMVYAQDGHLLVSGTYWDVPVMKLEFWVAKMTVTGQILWENHEPVTNSIIARAIQIQEDLEGNVVAAGHVIFDYTIVNDTSQILLRKYTSQGQLLWDQFFGQQVIREENSDLIVCNDGGYAILGAEKHFGLSEDYILLIKTDSDGQMLYTRKFGESPVEHGRSLIEMPNGNLLIAGNTWSLFEPQDQFGHGGMLLMLDANGQLLWRKKDPNNMNAAYEKLLLDDDGTFWALGQIGINSANDGDLWLVHYTPDGQIISDFVYGGTEDEYATYMMKNLEGGFYLFGISNSDNRDLCGNFGEWDAWMIQTDGAGQMIWQANMGGVGYDVITHGVPIPGGLITAGHFSPPFFPDTIPHALIKITDLQMLDSVVVDTTLCAGEELVYFPDIPCGKVKWGNAGALTLKYPGEHIGEVKNGKCKADFIFRAHFDPCSNEDCVRMPNAFTPNQDGANDVFSPIIICGDVDQYVFQVFNRWGQLVFRSDMASGTGWEGQFNGADSPSDEYVWQLSYHIHTSLYDEWRKQSGGVVLLR